MNESTAVDLTAAERQRLAAAGLRGRDYFEAERARAMRDVRPHDPAAGDVANVLRYALLDAFAPLQDGRPLDAATAKLIVEAQVALLALPQLDWLLASLCGAPPTADLPPLLTLAETEDRRARSLAGMSREMAAIKSERARAATAPTAAESSAAEAE